jgi:ATP-dependent helicase/nuclease subunit B
VTLPVGVELSARADRIEILNGRGTVADYKTGAPPKSTQVDSGLAPQLLLEAAMLARAGFEGVPGAVPEAFIYWRFARTEYGPREIALRNGDAASAAEEAFASLDALLGDYLLREHPFLCKPRVQFIRDFDRDYDLLARRKEWVDAQDVEWP